ncbi:MAG TPA: hypothetical protein VFE52_06270, partial [Devosia sp.]|nr:hypothetical protein [Devosia sp.]
MSLARGLVLLSTEAALLALLLPLGSTEGTELPGWGMPVVLVLAGAIVAAAAIFRLAVPPAVSGALALAGAMVLIWLLGSFALAGAGYWLLLVGVWLMAWAFAERLSNQLAQRRSDWAGMLVPLAFGATILVAWEAGVRGGNVPLVILPAPSVI